MRWCRLGDRGPAVTEIRAMLVQLGLLPAQPVSTTGLEPAYDTACDRAVRAFQQGRGLSVDGSVGPETYRALDEARWRIGDRLLSYAVNHCFVGDDVVSLQARLNELGFDAGRVDGVFGAETDRALREFQRNVGLAADGTCGPQTLRYLHQLGRLVVGGRPQSMRERELLHRAGPALAGKTVVIDAGHGGADPGSCSFGMTERDVVAELAALLEGRLLAAGVTAYPTHHPETTPNDTERAAFANGCGADLLLSLHVDHAPSPTCCGVATYYFGTAQGGGSAIGEQLADLIQREIVARTGLRDCRIHGKTWELLRLTKMPAVRIELGYLSNAGDARLLASPPVRDHIAEAILVGVQRLYLPAELDPTTGQLQLSALAG